MNINKLSKYNYKLTFSKIDKFLLYKVWSDSSQSSNENRSVYYENAKKWIKKFNILNNGNPIFTPTTVMRIGSKYYIFVINKAKINKDEHVVFKVSTKEIKLLGDTSEKMLKLPHGHYDNVRFDIDSRTWCILIPTTNKLFSGFFPVDFCANNIQTNSSVNVLLGFGAGGAYWRNLTGNWYAVETNSSTSAVPAYGAYGYFIINCTTNQLIFFSDFATFSGEFSTIANELNAANVGESIF